LAASAAANRAQLLEVLSSSKASEPNGLASRLLLSVRRHWLRRPRPTATRDFAVRSQRLRASPGRKAC